MATSNRKATRNAFIGASGKNFAARRNGRACRSIFRANMFTRRWSMTTRAARWWRRRPRKLVDRKSESGGQSRERGSGRQNHRRTFARKKDRQRRFRSRRISLSRKSESSRGRGARRRIQVLISWHNKTKADDRNATRTKRQRREAIRPRKSCSSIAAPKW